MDAPGSGFGELIEKGQRTAVNNAQKAVSDTASSVRSQISGSDRGYGAADSALSGQTRQPVEQTERALDLVNDYYSPSEATGSNSVQSQKASDEEQLAKIRKELRDRHNREYFEPLEKASVPHEDLDNQNKEQGPQIVQTAELPPLEETGATKDNKPLWVRRKMQREQSPGVTG